MADTSYIIKPRPPVRAFVIGAGASVAGAALLVVALTNQWHIAVVVLGAVLIAAGLALFVLGLLSMGRQQVTLAFTEDGYTLNSSQGREFGTWESVTRVTQSNDGRRVTIFEGEDIRHTLVFAPGGTADISKVLADMSQRLDTAKGYRNF